MLKKIRYKKGRGYENPDAGCDVRQGGRSYETCQTLTFKLLTLGRLVCYIPSGGVARSPVTRGVNECMHGYKAFHLHFLGSKNIAPHLILSHKNHCVFLHTLST